MLARIRGSRFGRHVMILTGGTVIGRAIVALASPLLSRIYSPADFGLLSVFFSLATTIGTIACLNYEAAIPLPKDDESGLNMMAFCFTLLFVSVVICATLTLLYGDALTRLVHTPQLKPYLWLLPINVLGGGMFLILSSWVIRLQAFKSLAKRRIMQSGFQVATQLLVPLAIRGPFGLLLGDSVGDVGLTPLLFDARKYVKAQSLRISSRKMIDAALRYRKFPVFGLASVLAHISFSVLPALLLARFFGVQEAGWYALVNQILVVAAGLIGLAIAQVYLSNAAQLAHSSPKRLRTLFFRTSWVALLLGLIPFSLLLFRGPWLFGFVFGAKWVEAGRYAQLLSLPFLVMIAVGPVYPTLTVLERQDWQFIADLVGVTMMVFGIAQTYKRGLSGRWAVGAYGLSVLITYLLLFGLSLYAIQRRYRENPL